MPADRFTFAGKGVLHHVAFALAMTIPIFIVFTLVLCARTLIATRKWLWLVFVALGVVLLGSGFVRSGPYAPVLRTTVSSGNV